MHFASPLWLLALVPWAGVVLWLLVARNPRVAVPFVELWKDHDSPRRRRARWNLQRPPASLACLLIAALLALVAAAKPTIPGRSPPIHVIIDHGVTMSGRSPSDRPWSAVLSEVRQIAGPIEVEGDESPSGLNTQDELIARVRAVAVDRDVVVISNQDLMSAANDPRVVQASIGPRENVGIVHVAAREKPHASVMVRVRNESAFERATIRLAVASAPASGDWPIELPSRGTERDYFFALDRVGEVVSVEIAVDDEIRADNRAWLVQGRSAPRIDSRTTVSPELERMISVYAKHRPGSSHESASIAIVDSEMRLGPADNGVVIPTGGDALDPASAIQSGNHPIVAEVRDWNAIVRDAVVARPPDERWTPILRSDNRVLVAVRDQPVRQAWVGFSSSTFARSTDFVIFWASLFDWLGGDALIEFRTETVGQLDSSWQRDVELSGDPVTAVPAPGIYRRSDGQARSMSSLDLKIDQPPDAIAWREKLASLVRHPRSLPGSPDGVAEPAGASKELAAPSRVLLLVSLTLIAVSALLWGGSRAPKMGMAATDESGAVRIKRLA